MFRSCGIGTCSRFVDWRVALSANRRRALPNSKSPTNVTRALRPVQSGRVARMGTKRNAPRCRREARSPHSISTRQAVAAIVINRPSARVYFCGGEHCTLTISTFTRHA
jgi:hypothetical protein